MKTHDITRNWTDPPVISYKRAITDLILITLCHNGDKCLSVGFCRWLQVRTSLVLLAQKLAGRLAESLRHGLFRDRCLD